MFPQNFIKSRDENLREDIQLATGEISTGIADLVLVAGVTDQLDREVQH